MEKQNKRSGCRFKLKSEIFICFIAQSASIKSIISMPGRTNLHKRYRDFRYMFKRQPFLIFHQQVFLYHREGSGTQLQKFFVEVFQMEAAAFQFLNLPS